MCIYVYMYYIYVYIHKYIPNNIFEKQTKYIYTQHAQVHICVCIYI